MFNIGTEKEKLLWGYMSIDELQMNVHGWASTPSAPLLYPVWGQCAGSIATQNTLYPWNAAALFPTFMTKSRLK